MDIGIKLDESKSKQKK